MTTDLKNSSSGELYVAVVLLKATHDDASPDTFAEEIVLLRASSEDGAKANASAWAEEQSTTYVSAMGVTVAWSPWCVVDVHILESVLPGESIYTRFFYDIEAYARFDALARPARENALRAQGSAATVGPSQPGRDSEKRTKRKRSKR